MKKRYSPTVWVGSIAFLAALYLLLSVLLGNPLSQSLIYNAAKDYLAEKYPNRDLQIVIVDYEATRGDYDVFVWSPTQEDLEFHLYYSLFVRLKQDTYEAEVASGWNTWERLCGEYHVLVSTCTINGDFPYRINYLNGELKNNTDCDFGLELSSLEPGGEYDIHALGAQHGSVTFRVFDEELTYDRAVAVMRDITDVLDKRNIPFRVMTFALQNPNPDGTIDPNRSIYATDFTREDIFAEDAAERVKVSDEAYKN